MVEVVDFQTLSDYCQIVVRIIVRPEFSDIIRYCQIVVRIIVRSEFSDIIRLLPSELLSDQNYQTIVRLSRLLIRLLNRVVVVVVAVVIDCSTGPVR